MRGQKGLTRLKDRGKGVTFKISEKRGAKKKVRNNDKGKLNGVTKVSRMYRRGPKKCLWELPPGGGDKKGSPVIGIGEWAKKGPRVMFY